MDHQHTDKFDLNKYYMIEKKKRLRGHKENKAITCRLVPCQLWRAQMVSRPRYQQLEEPEESRDGASGETCGLPTWHASRRLGSCVMSSRWGAAGLHCIRILHSTIYTLKVRTLVVPGKLFKHTPEFTSALFDMHPNMSGVQSSITHERTCVICTPMLRCTPEHWVHRKTPRLMLRTRAKKGEIKKFTKRPQLLG